MDCQERNKSEVIVGVKFSVYVYATAFCMPKLMKGVIASVIAF